MIDLRVRAAALLGLYSCLLTLGATPAGPAVAQEGEGSTFVDRVDVHIVNVEVFVTNKRGQAIVGLSEDDFELTVDGREVPISNFYAEEDDRPVHEASLADPAPADAPQGEASVPPEQLLRLVVFVDQTALEPLNRKRSFKHIRRFFAEGLAPADEIAVVSLAPGLRFHTDFTRDRELVEKILKELEKSPPLDLGTAGERRRVLQEISDGSSGPTSGASHSALSLIRAIAATEFGIRKSGTQALMALMGTLNGVPGRRAVLHVSSGIPTNPGEDLFLAWRNRFGQSNQTYQSEVGSYDLLRDFQEIAARANASKVTFYALDADPPAYSYGRSVEFEGDTSALPSVTGEVSNTHEANKRSTLELTAFETGGKRVVANGTLPRQLNRLGNDFRSFYSLGFEAPRGNVRDRHKVKVRVEGQKGWVVRHRAGYSEQNPDQEAASRTMAALLYGVAEDPLGVVARSGPAQVQEDGRTTLPLTIEIPFERLALLPDGDDRAATLSLFVTVQDKVGAARPVQRLAVRLRLPQQKIDEAPGRFARYVLPVVVGPDDRRVALGVRDDIAGVVSTLRVDLEPTAGSGNKYAGR